MTHSPEEGARRLALHYLDQAKEALPRLAEDGDDEALHDLRVALRRLRSCLKSYGAQLAGSVAPKLERRLRRVAQATGPGRDTEVQIEWVGAQSGVAALRPGGRRAGLRWLLQVLAERKAAAYRDLRDELAAEFTRLEKELRQDLSVYRAEIHLDDSRRPTFGDVAADLLQAHAATLAERLQRVVDAGDVEPAHQARISAKRLRYLADPLAPQPSDREPPAGSGAARPAHDGIVPRLKALQDLLGELHDAHVMEAELAAALADAAAQRAARLLALTMEAEVDEGRLRAERRRSPEPGLLALARLNRERRDRLFAEFVERWQGKGATALVKSTARLADALRARRP